jgi:uncharacterized alkaline shock family protein YloU
MMNSERESIGRIEVAPEVLTTIVRFATLGVEGVSRLSPAPPEVGSFFRRSARQDGIILDYADGKVAFDIYVLMKPNVNILDTSHALQTAVVEAIDTMVGIPVRAVNVHVEDVIFRQGEAV